MAQGAVKKKAPATPKKYIPALPLPALSIQISRSRQMPQRWDTCMRYLWDLRLLQIADRIDSPKPTGPQRGNRVIKPKKAALLKQQKMTKVGLHHPPP